MRGCNQHPWPDGTCARRSCGAYPNDSPAHSVALLRAHATPPLKCEQSHLRCLRLRRQLTLYTREALPQGRNTTCTKEGVGASLCARRPPPQNRKTGTTAQSTPICSTKARRDPLPQGWYGRTSRQRRRGRTRLHRRLPASSRQEPSGQARSKRSQAQRAREALPMGHRGSTPS